MAECGLPVQLHPWPWVGTLAEVRHSWAQLICPVSIVVGSRIPNGAVYDTEESWATNRDHFYDFVVVLSGKCRGLVQGRESECCGVGDSFQQNQKILSFKVSKFYFPNFRSFKVSVFQRFKNHGMLFDRYLGHIQDFQGFVRPAVEICRPPSFPKQI